MGSWAETMNQVIDRLKKLEEGMSVIQERQNVLENNFKKLIV